MGLRRMPHNQLVEYVLSLEACIKGIMTEEQLDSTPVGHSHTVRQILRKPEPLKKDKDDPLVYIPKPISRFFKKRRVRTNPTKMLSGQTLLPPEDTV